MAAVTLSHGRQASTKLAVSNSNGSHYPVFQDMLYKSNVMGEGHVCAGLWHLQIACDVMSCASSAGLASLVQVLQPGWLCKIVNIVGKGITYDRFIEMKTAS